MVVGVGLPNGGDNEDQSLYYEACENLNETMKKKSNERKEEAEEPTYAVPNKGEKVIDADKVPFVLDRRLIQCEGKMIRFRTNWLSNLNL